MPEKNITLQGASVIRHKPSAILGAALFFADIRRRPSAAVRSLVGKGSYPDTRWPISGSIVNHRYYQVGIRGMYVFHPAKEPDTGAAVLLCPGGDYSRITTSQESTPWPSGSHGMGMTAFVLIYRLPDAPKLIDRAVAPSRMPHGQCA